MKQWIENNIFRLVSNTSLLFTLMVLMYSLMGYSFDVRGIRVLFLAAMLITCSECVIFGIRGISRRCKWIVHYIWCFVAYILIMSIGKVFYPITQWDLYTLVSSVIVYTLLYVGLSWFYRLRYRKEVEGLNRQLATFKSQYREE